MHELAQPEWMKLGGAHSLGIQRQSRIVMGYGVGVEIASQQAQASFRGDENVLKLDCGNDSITLQIY